MLVQLAVPLSPPMTPSPYWGSLKRRLFLRLPLNGDNDRTARASSLTAEEAYLFSFGPQAPLFPTKHPHCVRVYVLALFSLHFRSVDSTWEPQPWWWPFSSGSLLCFPPSAVSEVRLVGALVACQTHSTVFLWWISEKWPLYARLGLPRIVWTIWLRLWSDWISMFRAANGT